MSSGLRVRGGRSRWPHAVVATALVGAVLLASVGRAAAEQPAQADGAGDGDVAQDLVETYAPIMVLKEQEGECDTEGEQYEPTRIDIVLDNPEVVLRQVGEGDPVVEVAPSASDLYDLNEGFFVDFPGSALAPGCVYEQDFAKYSADLPATVYAHVLRQDDAPDHVFVQYWFYWYFNDWNNKHESDWEGIVLRFEASTIAEALEVGPDAVGFAQHEGGERSDWDDPKLEREGVRPLVYSSAGSHASYYDSGVYLGRSASEGFGCDDTTGPSRRVDPEVILLPTEADGPDDEFAWLGYEGRWGERQSGPFNGPTGPASKDRWLDSAAWFDDLRTSSVVIPAGESAAGGVIDVFCGTVEVGSNLLVIVTTSPTVALIAVIVIGFVGRLLVRRTDWSVVPGEPVVHRRRGGQILRAAVRHYRRAPHVFALFGLVYLPAAFVTAALVTLATRLPVISTIVSLADDSSGTSVATAAFAGSVANVFALIVVSASVARYLDHGDRGVGAAVDAARTVWGSSRALVGAFVRSYALVFVLLISVIGLPWGVRQLVRYQFLGQSIAIDGTDGRSALSRSTELVRGRWWHTAVFTIMVNVTVGLVSLVAALLVLVVFTGIPLWLFSVLSGLVGAFVVPLAAIAMTLLYGDAASELDDARADQDDAEPVDSRDEVGAEVAGVD